MKIRPVEAEYFHADGQTDRYNEVKSRFSKFCKSLQSLKNMYKLQAGQPMDRGRIRDRDKRLFSVTQHPDRLQVHQASGYV